MNSYTLSTLTRRMKETGVTQKALSEITGISQPYISQILSGRRAPALDTFYSLCSAVSIDPASLIEDDSVCIIPGLTNEELRLLFAFRSLNAADQAFVHRIAQTLMVIPDQSTCMDKNSHEGKRIK